MMIGTLLNAAGILAGGSAGLILRREPAVKSQAAFKIFLGLFALYVGFYRVFEGLQGGILVSLKRLGVVMLAMILGNLFGRVLRIQDLLNRVARYAKHRLAEPASGRRTLLEHGFVVSSLLFCVTPLAVMGPLAEGLLEDSKPLVIKGAMDTLAALSFVRTFGWGVMLASIPVLAFQGSLTLVGRASVPVLGGTGYLASSSVALGMLICCVALVVLGAQRVRLGNYLPSLLFAPLLARWLW